MDYRIIIVTLCLTVLKSSVIIQCLECPDCMHIGYKFTKTPSEYKTLMVGLLDSFGLNNLACRANTTSPSECNEGGSGSVSKCVNVVVTVNAQGMKNVALEAGMEMEVVTRGCTSRPRSEQDTCNHISTLGDANTQASIMQALQRLTQKFNSVSYNGQVCYSSYRSGDNQQPTTNSWNSQNTGRGSTRQTDQWQKTTTDGSVSFANRVNVYKVEYFVWTLILLKTLF